MVYQMPTTISHPPRFTLNWVTRPRMGQFHEEQLSR